MSGVRASAKNFSSSAGVKETDARPAPSLSTLTPTTCICGVTVVTVIIDIVSIEHMCYHDRGYLYAVLYIVQSKCEKNFIRPHGAGCGMCRQGNTSHQTHHKYRINTHDKRSTAATVTATSTVPLHFNNDSNNDNEATVTVHQKSSPHLYVGRANGNAADLLLCGGRVVQGRNAHHGHPGTRRNLIHEIAVHHDDDVTRHFAGRDNLGALLQ